MVYATTARGNSTRCSKPSSSPLPPVFSDRHEPLRAFRLRADWHCCLPLPPRFWRRTHRLRGSTFSLSIHRSESVHPAACSVFVSANGAPEDGSRFSFSWLVSIYGED